MTLGEVVQAAAALVVGRGAFNWITDRYGRISEWATSANRVAPLQTPLPASCAIGKPGVANFAPDA
jgi:ABC-type uncharacterized transport system fused permease/ATPase subunit